MRPTPSEASDRRARGWTSIAAASPRGQRTSTGSGTLERHDRGPRRRRAGRRRRPAAAARRRRLGVVVRSRVKLPVVFDDDTRVALALERRNTAPPARAGRARDRRRRGRARRVVACARRCDDLAARRIRGRPPVRSPALGARCATNSASSRSRSGRGRRSLRCRSAFPASTITGTPSVATMNDADVVVVVVLAVVSALGREREPVRRRRRARGRRAPRWTGARRPAGAAARSASAVSQTGSVMPRSKRPSPAALGRHGLTGRAVRGGVRCGVAIANARGPRGAGRATADRLAGAPAPSAKLTYQSPPRCIRCGKATVARSAGTWRASSARPVACSRMSSASSARHAPFHQ